MRIREVNSPSGIRLAGKFGTAFGQLATVCLLVVACAAQNPPGVLYSTTIPYSNGQLPPTVSAIEADSAGNSYVIGSVSTNELAGTPGVLQPSFGGSNANPFAANAFVAKFDSNGTPVFLTYLGGSGSDLGTSILVDEAGHIFVGGTTTSSNFPLAGSPYRPALPSQPWNEALTFIAEISNDGKTLIWSTVLNETSPRLALGPDGSVYDLAATLEFGSNGLPQGTTLTKLTSSGQFVARLNTPLGTRGLAVGANGSPCIGGAANTNDISATPDAWQTTFAGSSEGFVAQLNDALSGYTWATYIGTGTAALLLAPVPDGSLWVTGSTASSTSFPVSPSALQSQSSPYDGGGFLVRLSADGSQAISATYLPIPPSSISFIRPGT